MNSENSPFKIDALVSFDKEILIPTSKSHANRALILGAIRGDGFKVHDLPTSTDVTHLIAAFKAIGLRMNKDRETVEFLNSFPACEIESDSPITVLKTGDGGTTNRFLIALLSRGKKEYHLYPSEKMSERPIQDLIDPLKKLDVEISDQTEHVLGKPWITVKGPASLYNTTKLSIDCKKSTQFASAMMLAFSNRPLQFEFLNLHSSEAYLEMTNQVIKKSLNSNSYTIPADFSSLSYPMALAALKGRVLIKNCRQIDEAQADSIFIQVLADCGALVVFTNEGLEVRQDKKLLPFHFQVSSAPDLFPTLVFLAAHIEGNSTLFDLSILEFKESSRLHEMINVMKKFGVEHEVSNDKLIIKGRSDYLYKQATVKPPRDHRIVMAAALFMKMNRGGNLFESDCVEKSFPHFFKAML